MIVLRGLLKADDNGTWRWKGVWAFGSLPASTEDEHQGDNTTTAAAASEGTSASATNPPAAAAGDNSNAESSNKVPTVATPRVGRPKAQPAASTRPFDYTWEKAVSPWQVLIPSANPAPAEHGDEPPQPATATLLDEQSESSKVKDPTAENQPSADAKMKEVDGNKPSSEQEGQKQDGPPVPTDTAAASIVANANDKTATAAAPSTESNDNNQKAAEAGEAVAEAGKLEEAAPNSTEPMQVDIEQDNKQSQVDSAHQTEDTKPQQQPQAEDNSITFATTMPGDPPFTDAAIANPDKCPPGGSWKGYFENLPKRRDKPNVQVPESFHLFFNATPPKDARVVFPDEPNDDNSKQSERSKQKQQPEDEGLLPPGHVHVRGCGTNEFGPFEIVGSLDLETGILECKRMYVAIPEASPSFRTPRRPSNDTTHSGARGMKSLRPNNLDSNDSNRPYLTRKRQLSWKRRSNYDSEGEDDTSSKKGSSAKKRVKLEDKPIIMPSLESTQVLSPIVHNLPPSIEPLAPAAATAVNRPKKLPSSPRLQPAKKKAVSLAAPPDKIAAIPTSTDTNRLKLPDAGDPRKARWRAAHFLYYQRHEPSTSEDGTTNSSSKGSSSTPSYVVYEGEMQDSFRWGFGICLYSNGMLYEGEWKRNKEHGKGTLMTSDRSRVIYEGEWERGRMHGKGIYYYGQADQINKKKDKKAKPDVNETSRYEGDFKENMRHGFGTYYLPDGSVYSGMWREGQMCGRGVFTWPDNSVYDGEFRDGKRNGQGLLKTSDGFSYDGMWVQNAMEGRGSAVYPNGQRYDGLFSNGRREGRGTIRFTNGAVYEGRFRDDAMDGQGTMKISRAVVVPRSTDEEGEEEKQGEKKDDFMIPVSFQSDMSHIHQKAGFTEGGE